MSIGKVINGSPELNSAKHTLVDACVHVVEGDRPNLMGRDWLSLLEVDLGEVNLSKNDCLLQTVLNKHCSVFNDELGCMKDMKVKLLLILLPSLSFSSHAVSQSH